MMAYNALLWWLSHQGHGTDEQFRAACAQLQLSDPHRVRRNLQLLGHIELKQGGHKWSINPTSWVQNPVTGHWFLCGQRSAAWLQAPGLKVRAQPEGPDLWEAERPLALPEPHTEVVESGCMVQRLYKQLLPIDKWIEDLVTQSLVHHVSAYAIEVWDPDANRFKPYTYQGRFSRNVYQFSRDMGRYVSTTRLYYYPPPKQRAVWMVADFTALRFVSAYHGGLSLFVDYNPQTQELWVPYAQRWPFIYERCLTLSTGFLPRRVKRSQDVEAERDFLYYPQIETQMLNYFVDEILDARLYTTEETARV